MTNPDNTDTTVTNTIGSVGDGSHIIQLGDTDDTPEEGAGRTVTNTIGSVGAGGIVIQGGNVRGNMR